VHEPTDGFRPDSAMTALRHFRPHKVDPPASRSGMSAIGNVDIWTMSSKSMPAGLLAADFSETLSAP
jgi:hypothetical protein